MTLCHRPSSITNTMTGALMTRCDQPEASFTTTTRSRLLEALLHEALNGAPGDQAEAAV